MLELKWKPKTDATSSDEEPAKPEKPTPEEVTKLRGIVINFDMEDWMWVNQLFVENRTIFLKWMNS